MSLCCFHRLNIAEMIWVIKAFTDFNSDWRKSWNLMISKKLLSYFVKFYHRLLNSLHYVTLYTKISPIRFIWKLYVRTNILIWYTLWFHPSLYCWRCVCFHMQQCTIVINVPYMGCMAIQYVKCILLVLVKIPLFFVFFVSTLLF